MSSRQTALENQERFPRRGEEEAPELGVGVGRGHFWLGTGAGVERCSTVVSREQWQLLEAVVARGGVGDLGCTPK